VKPTTYKSKAILKKKKIPIDVDGQPDEEYPNNIIDLDSESVVEVDAAHTQTSHLQPATTPLPYLTPL
jgi:hypothetical protein